MSFDVTGAFSVLFLPVVQDSLTHYVRGVLQIEQCLADAHPLSFHLRSIEQKNAGTIKMSLRRLGWLVNLFRPLQRICPQEAGLSQVWMRFSHTTSSKAFFQLCNDITDRRREGGENNPLLGVSMSLFTPRPPTNRSLRSGISCSRKNSSIKWRCNSKCSNVLLTSS